ncbi:MAG: hypothetical protein R3D70_12205 [Rhizobiaceae bacterium]
MQKSRSERRHIEILSIIPDRASVIHGVITRLDFSHIGRRTFLVDLVEEDGGRITMSDRTDYGRAIIDAEELARDFGCGVVDRVAGA